jgi:hypothetical protein
MVGSGSVPRRLVLTNGVTAAAIITVTDLFSQVMRERFDSLEYLHCSARSYTSAQQKSLVRFERLVVQNMPVD